MENKGLGVLAMMASGIYSCYSPLLKSEPHYFEYSGIPSEEQKQKSAERKARKKAKQLAKRLAR